MANQEARGQPPVIVVTPPAQPVTPTIIEPTTDWKETLGLILAVAGIGITLAVAFGLIKPPKKDEEEPPPNINTGSPPPSLPPPKNVEPPPQQPAMCHVMVETTYPFPHVHSSRREDYGSNIIETTQLWGYMLKFAVPTSCNDWFGGLYIIKRVYCKKGSAWIYTNPCADGFTELIIYPYATYTHVVVEYQHVSG